MNRSLSKSVRIKFILFMIAAFSPIVAFADSIGSFTPAASSRNLISPSRTVVVCDPGVVNCSAKSPENDFEGFVALYSNMRGLLSASQPPGADALTLHAGPALNTLVTDGFPRNTVFIDASAGGSALYHGFTLIEPAAGPAGPPVPTPEPSAAQLVACGLLGLGLSIWRLKGLRNY